MCAFVLSMKFEYSIFENIFLQMMKSIFLFHFRPDQVKHTVLYSSVGNVVDVNRRSVSWNIVFIYNSFSEIIYFTDPLKYIS